MPSAMDIAASIMADDVFRLNMISQNLANVGTTGYKRRYALTREFVDYLRANQPASQDTVLPVRLSSASGAIDWRQGTLTHTGNPLDLAIEGGGFFELQGADGPLYTRQGTFHLDDAGRVTNSAGLPLMGSGGPISLTADQPTIDQQGRVFEGGQQVAQLKLVKFSDPAGLAPAGGGMYISRTAGDVIVNGMRVRQGYLESSNVQSLTEMMQLIGLSRRFEAAQKLVQSYDGMLGKAISTLGQF
jgi:flagellar basal-body rod protein FlgF